MDRFHKISVLALIVLSVSLGWEAFAVPAPGRNTIITPGTGAPCDVRIYIDSGQYGAANCKTGDNLGFNTTPDFGALFNNVVTPACPVGGTGCNIYIEIGIYTVSTIATPDSKETIFGADRGGTILKAAASVAGSGNRGLLEIGTVSDTLVSYLRIENLGFDLTANSDTTVFAIHQSASDCPCAIQHLTIDKISMDLGTAHNGIQMEDLGHLAATPSFDITVRNIYAHNGNGVVNLLLNAVAATSVYYDVTIDTIYDVIDTNGVTDDRIAIDANFPSGGATPAEVRDVTVRNIYVNVSSAVTTSLVNGVKFDTGIHGYIHDFLVDGLYYMNNPLNTVGYGVSVLVNTGSKIQNEIFRNIFVKNSAGVKVQLSRQDSNPFILIDGFALYNLKGTIAGIEVFDTQGASGDETVSIRNGQMVNAAATVGQIPVGIMLTGGANQGASGMTTIDDVTINNFANAIADGVTETGVASTGSKWTNIYVNNVKFISVPVPLNKTQMIGNYMITNSPGFNPVGSVANPFSTAAIGTVGLSGSLGTVTASTDYVVNGLSQIFLIPCTGGTGVSITIKDGGGNTILSGLTCATFPAGGEWLAYGWKINYGAFSVAPTVSGTVFGN